MKMETAIAVIATLGLGYLALMALGEILSGINLPKKSNKFSVQ
jgi:hypothetical protein